MILVVSIIVACLFFFAIGFIVGRYANKSNNNGRILNINGADEDSLVRVDSDEWQINMRVRDMKQIAHGWVAKELSSSKPNI